MKPAPPERCIPKPRPLRSLYTDNSVSGKREANSTKLLGRKTTFKPPANSVKSKCNPSVQVTNIARRTQTGLKRKDSLRMLRAITSVTGVQQCPQMNGFFVRPSVDMRSLQQQIMERAKRMEDLLKTDGANSKALNHTIIKSPAVPCTPKPSGLSMAYIKLSNYKDKLAALRKGRLTPSLEQGFIQQKSHTDVGKVDIVNDEKNSRIAHSVSSTSQTATNQGRNEYLTVSSLGNIPADSSSNAETKRVEVVADQDTRHYALNNILKHCEVYMRNMFNLNKEIDLLDDEFQSVVMGKIDGHFQAEFLDYQNLKKKLYRKMERLEEELEESVKKELDVETKFKEYLLKKRTILKERTNLEDNFEKLLKEEIEKYQVDFEKPTKGENLEEIVKAMKSVDNERNVTLVEPVLRRSKRLLRTPRIGEEGGRTPGESPAPRKSKKREEAKKDEDKDELIVKRGKKSCDKRRIQTCIYKDLQKSFNLCSPECSF